MDKNKLLLIASVIFGVVGFLHALRAIFGWEVNIGKVNIPLYFSYVAVAVAGYLSWHMYKASTMK